MSASATMEDERKLTTHCPCFSDDPGGQHWDAQAVQPDGHLSIHFDLSSLSFWWELSHLHDLSHCSVEEEGQHLVLAKYCPVGHGVTHFLLDPVPTNCLPPEHYSSAPYHITKGKETYDTLAVNLIRSFRTALGVAPFPSRS